jgi:hypothetical protein
MEAYVELTPEVIKKKIDDLEREKSDISIRLLQVKAINPDKLEDQRDSVTAKMALEYRLSKIPGEIEYYKQELAQKQPYRIASVSKDYQETMLQSFTSQFNVDEIPHSKGFENCYFIALYVNTLPPYETVSQNNDNINISNMNKEEIKEKINLFREDLLDYSNEQLMLELNEIIIDGHMVFADDEINTLYQEIQDALSIYLYLLLTTDMLFSDNKMFFQSLHSIEERDVVNPSDNQIKGLQQLLERQIGDVLYKKINNSENTINLPVIKELPDGRFEETAVTEEDIIFEYMRLARNKKDDRIFNFTKLYYAIQVWDNRVGNLDYFQTLTWNFEAFVVSYSAIQMVFPEHIDNLEIYFGYLKRNLNDKRVSIIQTHNFLIFEEIYRALNSILVDSIITPFLNDIFFQMGSELIYDMKQKMQQILHEISKKQSSKGFNLYRSESLGLGVADVGQFSLPVSPDISPLRDPTNVDVVAPGAPLKAEMQVGEEDFAGEEEFAAKQKQKDFEKAQMEAFEEQGFAGPGEGQGFAGPGQIFAGEEFAGPQIQAFAQGQAFAGPQVFAQGPGQGFAGPQVFAGPGQGFAGPQVFAQGPGEGEEEIEGEGNPIVKKSRPSYNQAGGDCLGIDVNAIRALIELKFELEASHDLDSKRGKDALFGTENIFSVARAGVNENLYDKIHTVFSDIVGRVDPSALPDYEKDFITAFKINSQNMDEPRYLAAVIDAIVKHCDDKVDDFFYNPVIGYTLKDVHLKPQLYQILKQKILTSYDPQRYRVYMKTKRPGGNPSLYANIIKINEAIPQTNNTSLKLFMQDMGLEDALDMTFQETTYSDAFNIIFTQAAIAAAGGNTDIDNFFEGNFELKPAYTQQLVQAEENMNSGVITLDAATNIYKISGSIQIIDVPKLMDPLNVEKPMYGTIMDPVAGPRIKKLYVGYPNFPPLNEIGANIAGAVTSKATFDAAAGAQAVIAPFLTELNDKSVNATIEAINLLLSMWIENPGINKYQFILNAANNIIGIKFTAETALLQNGNPFTYTVHVGDLTVLNICQTMIAYFKNDLSNPMHRRVAEQMNFIRAHPRYRYSGAAGMGPEYGLAVIASEKSNGDEGQRAAAEYLKNLLETIANLSQDSQNVWLLTSDRPLVAQALLNFQPILAYLKNPHIAFGPTEDIGKIPEGIFSENVGLLSNRRSLISVSKSTIELLKESSTDLLNVINLLNDKTGMGPLPGLGPAQLGPAQLGPAITALSPGFIAILNPLLGQLEPIKGLADAAVRTLQQQADDKTLLTRIRKCVSEIKQLEICLEYYFTAETQKALNNKCIDYINDQIDYAISTSIDDKTYQNMVAFNGSGVHSRKQILDALKGMYDNIDFGPKLFDCHDVACELVIKKIQTYGAVLLKTNVIDEPLRTQILGHYENLIIGVTELNDSFFSIVVEKLEADIKNKTNRSTREGKKVVMVGFVKDIEEKDLPALQKNHDLLMAELTALQQEKVALDAANARLAQEEADAAAAAQLAAQQDAAAAAAAKKGKSQGFFKAANNFLKSVTKSLKTIAAEVKTAGNELTAKLKEMAKLEKDIEKANMKALATVHTKDPRNTITFLQLVKTKWDSVRGRRLGHEGGNKTRQNKQKRQKRYTKKRATKQTYRKKTQRHFKIKRRKYTKNKNRK